MGNPTRLELVAWAVLAAAFAWLARVLTGPSWETPTLVPSDSHYYVRFAQLQLAAFPAFHPADPFVNFPEGARILWPPLHAWLVAAALALGDPSRLERSAAWVGPFVAALELGVLAALLRRWLPRAGVLTAVLLLALVPAAVEAGAYGNADHHVHEVVWPALLALCAARVVKTHSAGAAVLLGVLLAMARLFTTVSFAWLPPLALAFPLATRLGGRDLARPAALTGAVAAITSALAVLVFGEPRSLDYEALGALHPLWAVAWFSLAAGLCRGGRWALAGFLPLAGIALLLGHSLSRGAAHLAAADLVLGSIVESQPLLTDPAWALELLGPSLVLGPLAAWLVSSDREGRAEAAPGLLLAAALSFGAAAQARFAPGLVGAVAVVCALAAARLAALPGRSRRLVTAAAAVALLPLAASLKPQRREKDPGDPEVLLRPTFEWMSTALPPAGEPPAYGIAAWPLLGHLILRWAERPVLGAPFSQRPVHVRGNQRAADLLLARSDEAAWVLALASRARFAVITPVQAVPNTTGQLTLHLRLYRHAGFPPNENPSSHFRWIYDSAERHAPTGLPVVRLFEIVPGAELSSCSAQAQVWAAGAEQRYRIDVPEGLPCVVRVAYPGEYQLAEGGLATVTEADVRLGRRVPPR